MKIPLLFIALAFTSSLVAQKTLKDSLFGGKLRSDTGRTIVSTDTSKYVQLKNENISSQSGDKKKTDAAAAAVLKPDESMPDSLNKLYYSKQKLWKRFIESNTQIVTQAADDTRKVKKGVYTVEIEYTIGVNGRITTNNITCSPTNEFLLEQVTEFMKRAPVLAPPIYSDGQPRALSATQPITITKK